MITAERLATLDRVVAVIQQSGSASRVKYTWSDVLDLLEGYHELRSELDIRIIECHDLRKRIAELAAERG